MFMRAGEATSFHIANTMFSCYILEFAHFRQHCFWEDMLSLLAFILFPMKVKYHIFCFLSPKHSTLKHNINSFKFLVGCLIDSKTPYCICSYAFFFFVFISFVLMHIYIVSRLEILVHIVGNRSDNFF